MQDFIITSQVWKHDVNCYSESGTDKVSFYKRHTLFRYKDTRYKIILFMQLYIHISTHVHTHTQKALTASPLNVVLITGGTLQYCI